MDNGNYEWGASVATTSAASATENNNPPNTLASTGANRGSTEDLSEYTDADESVSSAPTEFLAEFLSAVMMKEYVTALKYCKLILQYEPNNVTAKEFYPLIVEKIRIMHEQDDSDEASSSCSSSSSSVGSKSGGDGSSEDATSASYSSLEDEEVDVENGNRLPRPKTPTNENYNSNKGKNSLQSTSTAVASSDSESPTEPISQKLAGVN